MKKEKYIILTALMLMPLLIENVLSDPNSETEITITVTPILFPKGVVTENSVEEIRQDYNGSNHIIFSLDLLPAFIILKREMIIGNISLEYYLKDEEIIAFSYMVETIPQNLNVSKMELTLTLPNNSILSYNLSIRKNNPEIYRLHNPIKLKDCGLLQIEVRFDASKDCIVWRNISSEKNGFYITFNPKGNTTRVSISFSNIYREAIPILSPAEAIMMGERLIEEKQTAITSKQTAILEKQTQIEEKQTDIFWWQIFAIIMGPTIGIILSYILKLNRRGNNASKGNNKNP